MSILSIIVAFDHNRLIGRDNGLPWRLSFDLQRFKRLTTGHAVVMGRKTHESIGRPLPNRLNVVVTRQAAYRAEGCTVVHSLDDALEACRDQEEVFIIGGASIYAEAMPLANRLYLTRVDAALEGDAWFPELDLSGWTCISSERVPADERNEYAAVYEVLER